MYKSRRGITLIALVVTIIVLLLLAGIAISMLSGNNSILNKATEAKNKNSEGQIREEIALAWNAVQAKAIPAKWTLEEKRDALQTELRNNGDDTATVTIDSENAKMLNIRYKGFEAEINTENDAINVTGGNGNSGNGGTTGGTASAENILRSGDYVTYDNKDYAVLYDATSTYGRIELIQFNSSANATLGNTDPAELATTQAGQAYVSANNITLIGNPGTSGTFERAKWSYNNAVATLNYKAQAYLIDIADRARCVGSNPSDPNKPDNESNPSMYSDYPHPWNNEFKVGNTHHEADKNQLQSYGSGYQDYIWLASRCVVTEEDDADFSIRGQYQGWGYVPLCRYEHDSNDEETTMISPSTNHNRGFMPVLRLKPGVRVTGGNGSGESPYTLALGSN